MTDRQRDVSASVPTLVSLNVGLPKDVPWAGHTVHTGIWKVPVDGPRMVRRLNIDGDGQGDLAGHGGEQRAVLVYSIDSYRFWEQYLDRHDFEYGQFGENFTVDGLSDGEVCIGDRYQIGDAEFEVTQPRVTCFRLAMRLGEPTLPALFVAHHRPGFYLRVISEGHVRAGDEIVRTRVGRHEMTVADINDLLYLPDRDVHRLRAALDIPALSPGWQRSFHDLLAAGPNGAGVPGQPAAVHPAWSGFRPLRVQNLVSETAAITSVYLAAEDDRPLPPAQAGQFLTVRVAGAGEPAPVRSYSLSTRSDRGIYRISVKQEPQGVVSGYIHDQLRARALLDAAAPRGEFVLSPGLQPVLLLSAGVGVTPVLAMLHELAATDSQRAVWWVHTARSRQQHAFADEAHQLVAGLAHAQEHVFYTDAEASEPVPFPTSHGTPTTEALRQLGVPSDANAYLCGPAGFMSSMQRVLAELGLSPDGIRTELFGALAPINPGVVDATRPHPHLPSGPHGAGPRITFARSGLTVPWSDRNRSLLELAEACDVPTRFSCRTGVCHTCITPVVTGDVTYDPTPLEPPEAGFVLVCCARPAGQLVLDL